MKVILFGATGMVGAGVLRQCLADDRVESVLAVGRNSSGVTHPKLEEIRHIDFFNYTAIQPRLTCRDAFFFCLGVSSAGMGEAKYRRLTFDLTIAAARAVVEVNPRLTFCYVSGKGTDSTERSSSMWARIKGATENALLRMPFKAAFMFRPGFIQPLDGIRSKTRLYQAFYTVTGPLYPMLRRLAPGLVTTTTAVGRAMIRAVAEGYSKPILETTDINALGEAP
jgi:uncharacterized protein YbjT (DUF2867 family)